MFRRGYDLKPCLVDPDAAPDAREDAFPPPAAAPKTPLGAPVAVPRPAPKPVKKPPPVDPQEQKKLEKRLKELRLNAALLWATVWGRLFGGALVIMGAMDGQAPDQPLNEDNLQSFTCLNVVDRRYVWVQRYYSDPMQPSYGMPELYLITNMVSGNGLTVTGQPSGISATTVIHETRVIRFDGNETDDITRQQLAGWTFSVLQTVYDTMKKFEHAFDSVAALMADASQGVFKLQGLIDAISSGDTADLQARMAAVDMGRSTIKAILLDKDADEDFSRVATTFGGLSDLLDKWMARLCAAADMPRSELFGESPGGLNANSEGETRKWYDMIASAQQDELGPKIKRIVDLVSKAADSPVSNGDNVEWEIVFRPLWAPTDKEDAEYRLAVAQADSIYLTAGVVTPEQVALGRWGGNKFSPNIEVDVDALQAAIEGKVMADPYENEPEPDPTIAMAPASGQTPGPATRTQVISAPGVGPKGPAKK
jgi:phage-related protein (TIGR01555 family)